MAQDSSGREFFGGAIQGRLGGLLEQANQHLLQGQSARAMALYRRVLDAWQPQTEPERVLQRGLFLDLAALYRSEGLRLEQAGQWPLALRAYGESLRFAPLDATLMRHLGQCFYALEDAEGSKACYLRALALEPEQSENLLALAKVEYELSQDYLAALGYYERYLANTEDPQALTVLGRIYFLLGLTRRAVAAWERALALNPRQFYAFSNLMFALRKLPEFDQPALLARMRVEIAAYLEAWPGSRRIRPFGHARPVPGKKLHIAYLSPAFRAHPVAYFLLPLLEQHDRSRYRISCYSTSPDEDWLTAQYRALDPERFVACAGMDEQQLAQRIFGDGVDILIDLAGYESQENGIFSLKYRPAPIQAGYLTSISTYGLDEVQTILTHPDLSHADEQAAYTERLCYLETYCCYRNLEHQNLPERPPRDPERPFVFGMFNQPGKITSLDWQLWARILRALPESRLLICRNVVSPAHLEPFFAAAGLPVEQVIYSPYRLENYALCDLQLDPHHFNGMTVTLDSLLMDVPVLTLPGSTMTGRMAAHLLRQVGLDDWIARDPDDYVAKAVACARGPALTGLRQRLLSSPLCDYAGFTRGLEAVYDTLWQAHCQSFAEA